MFKAVTASYGYRLFFAYCDAIFAPLAKVQVLFLFYIVINICELDIYYFFYRYLFQFPDISIITGVINKFAVIVYN